MITIDLSLLRIRTLAFLYMDTQEHYYLTEDGVKYSSYRNTRGCGKFRVALEKHINSLPVRERQEIWSDVSNIKYLGCACGN